MALLVRERYLSILKAMAIVGLFTIPILVLVELAYRLHGIPLGIFLKDANATMDVPFYTGFVSNLGLILWGATITICFFTFFFLRQIAPGSKDALFLLCAGLFSLLLLSDDMLQFHEFVFPHYFGIHEKVVYAIYGSLTLLFLFNFRDSILRSEYELLIMAFIAFGTSIASDIFLEHTIIEDGTKFIGIATWLAYFVRVSQNSINSTVKVDVTLDKQSRN